VPVAGGVTAVLPNPALGMLIFFPTVFPLPERQELLRMVEDAFGGCRLPAHLKDWADLIATDNPGRGTAVPRLARIYRVHHYWRVLFSRHAGALDRQIGKLHAVFAEFLLPNSNRLSDPPRVIKEDLIDLAQAHGGADWYRTPTLLEAPPARAR